MAVPPWCRHAWWPHHDCFTTAASN